MNFVECDSCRAKPGSPTLCPSCLERRAKHSRAEEGKTLARRQREVELSNLIGELDDEHLEELTELLEQGKWFDSHEPERVFCLPSIPPPIAITAANYGGFTPKGVAAIADGFSTLSKAWEAQEAARIEQQRKDDIVDEVPWITEMAK